MLHLYTPDMLHIYTPDKLHIYTPETSSPQPYVTGLTQIWLESSFWVKLIFRHNSPLTA